MQHDMKHDYILYLAHTETLFMKGGDMCYSIVDISRGGRSIQSGKYFLRHEPHFEGESLLLKWDNVWKNRGTSRGIPFTMIQFLRARETFNITKFKTEKRLGVLELEHGLNLGQGQV